MRKIVMYCDRCKKEFKNWNHERRENIGVGDIVHGQGDPYLDDQKDLCESCYDELEKWWNFESNESKSYEAGLNTAPHNPSIGDMIMALFPSAKTQIIAGCFVRVTFENHENLDVSFPVGLWNSPYPNPTETNSDDNTYTEFID